MPSAEPAAGETEAVVRALADPATYGDASEAVEHVQTHISHVFLTRRWVYKLKKPVTFPFLDFGSVEQRRYFCEEEVRLNRRLAPDVYLGLLPVTVEHDGRIRLGGEGRVVDHVVWMRRLPAERLLPALLGNGTVDDATMDALAARLVAFHAAASSGPDVAAHAAPERLAAAWAENLADAAPFAGRLLAAEDLDILTDFGPRFARTHETLLGARQLSGRIREGHGDLHTEHVCILAAGEGDLPPLAAGIYVFDCIEFSRALRCTDVAAEVAFLAMDLERRGHPGLAQRFVAAYAAGAEDHDLARLLPFYVCARACVRGKVEGLKSEEGEVDAIERDAARARAHTFFALALRHAWQASGPAVVAVGGLSGSGKSTLATPLAEATGFTPLSSDVLRKQRADVGAAASAYDAGLYTPQARGATYATLCAEVDAELAAGHGVVADATWMRRADRRRLAAVARGHRRPLVFLECRAEEATIHARLSARTAGASLSDARWDTYLAQRRTWEPFADDEAHHTIDTDRGVATARAAALRYLWSWLHGHAAGGTTEGSPRGPLLTCKEPT